MFCIGDVLRANSSFQRTPPDLIAVEEDSFTWFLSRVPSGHRFGGQKSSIFSQELVKTHPTA